MSIHRFPGPSRNGAEPPTMDPMEARVAKLEATAERTAERLAAIERDLAVMKSNYSTKADVAEGMNKVIMWVVGAIFLAQLLPSLLKKFGM
jgi:hypothetical protein